MYDVESIWCMMLRNPRNGCTAAQGSHLSSVSHDQCCPCRPGQYFIRYCQTPGLHFIRYYQTPACHQILARVVELQSVCHQAVEFSGPSFHTFHFPIGPNFDFVHVVLCCWICQPKSDFFTGLIWKIATFCLIKLENRRKKILSISLTIYNSCVHVIYFWLIYQVLRS